MGVKIANTRLTRLIERYDLNKHNKVRGFYRCECGTEKPIINTLVRTGKVKSCGCYGRSHSTSHGMHNSKAYRAWQDMKDRCLNPNNPFFHRYGERGIKVCESWLKKFENFYSDMGTPQPYQSLDRIDNDGHYEKENCRWAEVLTQNNNTSSCKIIEFNGQRLTQSQWARNLNIPKNTLAARLTKLGWDIEKALTAPVKLRRRKNG